VHLSKGTPLLQVCFRRDSSSPGAQFGFLDESAGNALGQVLIGLVLGGQLIKLRGQEWWWWLEGRVYHMDENSWIGLLAWFFTQARL